MLGQPLYPVRMGVAPVVINGRTMLPARWVAQELGYNVQLEPDKRQVVLTQ